MVALLLVVYFLRHVLEARASAACGRVFRSALNEHAPVCGGVSHSRSLSSNAAVAFVVEAGGRRPAHGSFFGKVLFSDL